MNEQDRYKKTYAKICEVIPDFSQFTCQEFLETISLIYSRYYNLSVGDQEMVCMVPYADMFNHKDELQTTFSYDNWLEGFRVIAKRNIRKGEEVCSRYGQELTNLSSFLGYGFIQMKADSTLNIVMITLRVDKF